jgi:tRNA U34 5-carboxymethylaminomethyl modifying enzyme MnmG/GidA
MAVVRFSERDSHQIFVEPEGLMTNEVYPNGISTSLPYEVQQDFIRSIKGFENVDIVRPGGPIPSILPVTIGESFKPLRIKSCVCSLVCVM